MTPQQAALQLYGTQNFQEHGLTLVDFHPEDKLTRHAILITAQPQSFMGEEMLAIPYQDFRAKRTMGYEAVPLRRQDARGVSRFSDSQLVTALEDAVDRKGSRKTIVFSDTLGQSQLRHNYTKLLETQDRDEILSLDMNPDFAAANDGAVRFYLPNTSLLQQKIANRLAKQNESYRVCGDENQVRLERRFS